MYLLKFRKIMASMRLLSMRQQFFSADSACGINTKWWISASIFKIKNCFPVPKSPAKIQDLLMLKTRGRNSHTWAPLTSFTPSTYTILGKVLKEGDQQGAQLFCIGSHEGKQSVFRYSVCPPPLLLVIQAINPYPEGEGGNKALKYKQWNLDVSRLPSTVCFFSLGFRKTVTLCRSKNPHVAWSFISET